MSDQLTSRTNPVLSAFRGDDVRDVGAWVLALYSLEDCGPVQDMVLEVLGHPDGTGWEDQHWVWSGRVLDHACKVLERLEGLGVATNE